MGNVHGTGAGQGHGVIPGPGQLRFRRINITKPHQPNFFRKKLLAISKPMWDETIPIEDEPKNCAWVEKNEEKLMWDDHVNQLEKFYVKEMVDLFHTSKMIAFYHTNPMPNCNFRKAWQNGRRMKMELKKYNIRVGKKIVSIGVWGVGRVSISGIRISSISRVSKSSVSSIAKTSVSIGTIEKSRVSLSLRLGISRPLAKVVSVSISSIGVSISSISQASIS